MDDDEPMILAVDDTPANLLAVEAILEPLGVRILRAHSGARAVREILEHAQNLAVMLLDVHMPDLDGFETAKLVRSRESVSHIPIIFLTAISREEANIVKGYAHGAVDYMVKPFSPDALRAKVSFFVEAHRRAANLGRQQRLSSDRLALAVEAADLGVWGWDAQSGMVTCDARCRELLGASPEQEVDLGAFRLPITEPLPPSRTKLQSEHQSQSGQWIRVEARVFGDSRADARIVGLISDVSDQRRDEAERELFLGVLGHDLRNPLQTISLGASALAEHDDPTVAGPAARLARAARYMTSLLSDVLDFVRIRAGTLPIARVPFDLRSVCADIVAEEEAAQPGCQLVLESEGDTQGSWDPARVQQAVQNVVGNAIRHGAAGEPVRVFVRGVGPAVTIEVENAGPPIDDEIRSRIFEPFVSGRGGSGLGLYITRRMVEAHGGRIEVESDPNRTVFRITLPRA